MAKSIQHNVAYVACGSGCASAGGDARCSEGCIGCGACVTACPHGAIALVFLVPQVLVVTGISLFITRRWANRAK